MWAAEGSDQSVEGDIQPAVQKREAYEQHQNRNKERESNFVAVCSN